MRILYDDLYEFSQVVIRCENTVNKGKCQYCPFFDRCEICDPESRHIQFGDIVKKERSTISQNK